MPFLLSRLILNISLFDIVFYLLSYLSLWLAFLYFELLMIYFVIISGE